MAQHSGFKDPALLQLQLRLQLQLGFSPWPGNFHMPWVAALKKKKKERKKRKQPKCFLFVSTIPTACESCGARDQTLAIAETRVVITVDPQPTEPPENSKDNLNVKKKKGGIMDGSHKIEY